ncbi:MAG TPA: NADH-quinone oxidoreductase subunit C [Bacteroidales bacterium]|nr:NADH-quinone oxidoreductase subunit C [Bacteroidales bacterium]HRX98405.1 NADH-quinone oxidoreductase subunit C [Bacteroidales bacterium]
MKDLIEKLSKTFELKDVVFQRPDLSFVTVKKETVISLVTHLRDYEGFSHFVLLSCVDWIEDNLFQLTYFLNNPDQKYDLAIRCMIDRTEPTMTSAHHLWKQIATYQRELKEMYGIDFPGSPRLNENFILEGWDNIPPMRRDFDTKKYAEETFFPRERPKTNDPSKYMKSKLYPDE